MSIDMKNGMNKWNRVTQMIKYGDDMRSTKWIIPHARASHNNNHDKLN